MTIDVQLTAERIEDVWRAGAIDGGTGATVEFRGLVRAEEAGRPIAALLYEAYEGMAVRTMREILETEGTALGCAGARVIHRRGRVPVGEAAVLVWIEARHRAEAFALLATFMDRLKREVPIWKVGVEAT